MNNNDLLQKQNFKEFLHYIKFYKYIRLYIVLNIITLFIKLIN